MLRHDNRPTPSTTFALILGAAVASLARTTAGTGIIKGYPLLGIYGWLYIILLCFMNLARTVTDSETEFTVIPISTSVSAGEIAIFTCRHLRPSAYIKWRINETNLQLPYPRGVSILSEQTLRIYGHPFYNGTKVQCLAFFLHGGHDSTTTVILTVHTG